MLDLKSHLPVIAAIVAFLGLLVLCIYLRGERDHRLAVHRELELLKKEMGDYARKEAKLGEIMYSLIAFSTEVFGTSFFWSGRVPKAARTVGRRLRRCLLDNCIPGLGLSSEGFNKWVRHLEVFSSSQSPFVEVNELAFWGDEAPWGAWMLMQR